MLPKKPQQRYFAKHTNIIHQLISSALSMSMTYSQFPPKYYTHKQSTLSRQMNPEFFLGGKMANASVSHSQSSRNFISLLLRMMMLLLLLYIEEKLLYSLHNIAKEGISLLPFSHGKLG